MRNVIELLQERGLIEQMTDKELGRLCEKPIKVYVGFDPTADSLHLGNLTGLVILAWMQKLGHAPYALIGGATGRIGDPSGKSAERPLLNDETLQANVRGISALLKKILHFPSGSPPVIVDNGDWLGSFALIDFLRDVGKHFRIGAMMAKESVRARLQSEEGMSFTEFSYQILQAYDFHYLNRTWGVSLQMGGSDQWGNITAGIEFNRRLRGAPLYGATWPLLVRSDGKKFGKSEEGAIWLSPEKLSPYHFYQYLFRIPDADVIRLLKMLTFLDLDAIRSLEEAMGQPNAEPNAAQKRLAEELTLFVHGQEGLDLARRATAGLAPGTDTPLSSESLKEIAADVPRLGLPLEEIVGVKYIDLALKASLIASKGEGVRLIKNGGAYLNNRRVEEASATIASEDLIDGSYLLLASGKKNKVLVERICFEK